MNTTNLHAILFPFVVNLLDAYFDHQLHSTINAICETHSPKYVFHEDPHSPWVERLLDRYLMNSSELHTIITDMDRNELQIPFDSCLLLFGDATFSEELLKTFSAHRKLIINSIIPSDRILRLISENGVFDAFFTNFNQSHWTVLYHNHFEKGQLRWSELEVNHRIDFGGSTFQSTLNTKTE